MGECLLCGSGVRPTQDGAPYGGPTATEIRSSWASDYLHGTGDARKTHGGQ